MAIQAAWRLQVLATFHFLWRWRIEADTDVGVWTTRRARAYHDGCLNAALQHPQWPRTKHSAASCHTAAAITILRAQDPKREIEPAPTAPEPTSRYILYFDGGSRGNPGPGGSGAVVVRTTHDATSASVLWTAAVSSARSSTTNNQAEYLGVLTGLRAAHAHGWTPLEVVGDSQLIIKQLQRYRSPRNAALHDLYAEARRLGDVLGVQHWKHHVREFNKMADAAANLAMDQRASSQVHHPTTREDHHQLARFLGSDFAHWQQSHFASTS